MESSSKIVTNAAVVMCLASALITSETARVGGDGGRRTVTMDCGSGAFIVGLNATGWRDGSLVGFNLVRKLKFTCQPFNGITPTGVTTHTTEAASDQDNGIVISSGFGDCLPGRVMQSLDLQAGAYIDRITSGACIDANAGRSFVTYNVGGDGGVRAGLACPAAEGLFKVVARVGDAIDSLKGYCRPFAAAPPASVPDQILATPSPKPTSSTPLVVGLKAAKTISFKITDPNSSFSTAFVGVSAETDLLGGSGLNPPEFTLELLNPSGSVVATKTFNNPRGIAEVTYHFNVAGTWKLRITNLKKDVGFLNVTGFFSHG